MRIFSWVLNIVNIIILIFQITRNDKDRAAAQAEYDALNEAHENLQKQKTNLEKTARMLDEQLGDSNSRCSTMETNLRDLADKYNK